MLRFLLASMMVMFISAGSFGSTFLAELSTDRLDDHVILVDQPTGAIAQIADLALPNPDPFVFSMLASEPEFETGTEYHLEGLHPDLKERTKDHQAKCYKGERAHLVKI